MLNMHISNQLARLIAVKVTELTFDDCKTFFQKSVKKNTSKKQIKTRIALFHLIMFNRHCLLSYTILICS